MAKFHHCKNIENNMQALTIHQALQLRGEPDSYERQENMWLLADILKCTVADLKWHNQKELSAEQQQLYLKGLQRIADGEPLAYITGTQPFWSLDLIVTPETLVPRPDTEVLVEQVLGLALSTQAKILDLGTGSGAIVLSLASERQDWQLWATDIAQSSLDIAQQNAEKHHIQNVTFQCGCWFEALPAGILFDVIVSNPPYIAKDDPHMPALTKEPLRALVAEDNGLADLAHIIHNAPNWLAKGGYLLLEHGYQQAQAVQQLLLQAGFEQVKTIKDYAGNDRVSMGILG